MSLLKRITVIILLIVSAKVSLAQCCGNGICEPGENATNCPYDCGASSFNCGNTVGSFFSSPTWPVSSATAQSNGWCYTFTAPYPTQVCFEYRVPNVGDSASVSFSIDACGGTSINQSNYPPLGGCNNAGYGSATITGVSTYNNSCTQVSSSISTGGPGCYSPGDIITVCIDINPATTCPQIVICPVIACGMTNCATTPTPIGCPPFNFTDSSSISPCDSTSGIAVVTPDCGSHFTYLWDDPLAQTDSLAFGLTPGSYTVTITNTAFNCDTTITVVVPSTTNPSDATISPAGPFCENDAAVNLTAVDPGGTWSGTGITNSTNGTFDPNTAGPGNHTITYMVGSGPCGDTNSISINVSPVITAPLTASICQGDSILLGGSFQNSSGVYNDTINSSLNCDSILQTTLTVIPIVTTPQATSICQGDSILLGGTFQNSNGVYNDTLTSSSNCDSILQTTLTIIPTVFTPQTTSICQGDSILLEGAFQNSNGVYNDTLTSSSNCDSVLQTTLTVNPIVTTQLLDSICQGDSILLGGSFQSTAGTYYDTLQSSIMCDSIIETILSINALPIITTSPDTSICNGLTVNINASGATNYSWDNGLGNGQNHNVTPSSTTTYIVTGTDNNNCSDTSSVTVSVVPLTLAYAGSDQEICDNITSFTLNGNQPINAGESGLWTTGSSATINSPNQPNTNGSGLVNGNNIFIWTISSGTCPSSSDSVIINLDNCDPSVVIIPNVFTPNGDGMNDLFTIDGIKIESLECDIYNRWGQHLYSWVGVKGSWDGRTTAGVEVPDGTYFYLLKATGEDEVEHFKKGSFSLIR